MTKARNRSAYEQRCQEMEKLKPDAPLTVFMFDINNLKHTNDTYGHHAGDTIIRSLADLSPNTVFTDIGQIYRVGGDEFVVLSEKNYMSAQAMFSLLDQRLKEYNQTAELPLSIAKDFPAIHPGIREFRSCWSWQIKLCMRIKGNRGICKDASNI